VDYFRNNHNSFFIEIIIVILILAEKKFQELMFLYLSLFKINQNKFFQ